jgi:hypothetical protein
MRFLSPARRPWVGLGVLCAAFALLTAIGDNLSIARPRIPAKSKYAWTYDEALAQLRRNPRDPYLQYVVMQLAYRDKTTKEARDAVAELLGKANNGQKRPVDLFSLLNGSLAVQESLQLDTMMGEADFLFGGDDDNTSESRSPASLGTIRLSAPGSPYSPVPSGLVDWGPPPIVPTSLAGPTQAIPTLPAPVAVPSMPSTAGNPSKTVSHKQVSWKWGGLYGDVAAKQSQAIVKRQDKEKLVEEEKPTKDKRKQDVVKIADLKGPEIKSHNWKKMLRDKKPDIDPLAKMVPADFYFVQFKSLKQLVEAVDSGDLWGTHLYNQTTREARKSLTVERFKKQLGLEHPDDIAALDAAIEEVAATGSDLYLNEGSDVTLVFRVKDAAKFKKAFDEAWSRERPGRMKEADHNFPGQLYRSMTSFGGDRSVHKFRWVDDGGKAAVLSNCEPALQHVLGAVLGKDAHGKKVQRLGDTTEFAYIRTLMPRGASEEDGFVYLSDPFIRRIVSPEVKLAQRRRMIVYNHLRMIGHAALMYRTEFGKAPKSLDDLIEMGCTPGQFNRGHLVCPDGGKYILADDGLTGINTVHGTALNMVPLLETPLKTVNGLEADEYRRFVEQYSEYWKTYFDPIAVRIKAEPKRYRVETIVLPLIDNSIYSGLAQVFKGKPAALDGLPVPAQNVGTIAFQVNWKELVALVPKKEAKEYFDEAVVKKLGLTKADLKRLDPWKLLTRGLGSEVSLHAYDHTPTYELDMPRFLGMALGGLNGSQQPEILAYLLGVDFLGSSISMPFYGAVKVADAEVVDAFLAALDKVATNVSRQNLIWDNDLAAGGISLDMDFYKTHLDKKTEMRVLVLSIGPAKWRLHWARIGDGLYFASKDYILRDILALTKDGKTATPDPDTEAHLMLKVRGKNFDGLVAGFKRSWAENNRRAAMNNLSPIANVARALAAVENPDEHAARPLSDDRPTKALEVAEKVYGVRFLCPDGGAYVLSADGKTCSSTIHGSVAHPKQRLVPGPEERKQLMDFGGLTASLTFRKEGLHAVVVVEKK